jgi:Ni/Fe-hydrogenase subunit HybB-like protein
MAAMPETRLSPEEIDRLARKRAGAKLGWYIHATVFVVVNIGLFAMSTQGWGHRAWRPGPVIGWGFGLALHWISVFLLGRGSALRERMVRQERERIERAQRDAGP